MGRGPLAGPVVTAAVVLPDNFNILGVDDSKKISEKKREQLFEEILGCALAVGIGVCEPQRIDEINILEATKEAMGLAVGNCDRQLAEKFSGAVIEHLLIDAVKLENVDKPQTSIIKGDATCSCIAAASIVAKVTRDRMMREYADKYPDYAFEKNKGYGTKAHYEGLKKAGITPIHRRTFLRNLWEH